jgi:hypothetical protein
MRSHIPYNKIVSLGETILDAKPKDTHPLLTNNPLPTVPLPEVRYVIMSGKVFKMRGSFHDKWEICLCRTFFNKTHFEDSE